MADKYHERGISGWVKCIILYFYSIVYMKTGKILAALVLGVYVPAAAGWFGLKPVGYDRSIVLHNNNYGVFISGFKPDSVAVIYRQPKEFTRPLDSLSTLFEVRGSYIYSSRKNKQDFIRDPALNRQLVQQLIALNDLSFFRLFYKNASGQVYKYDDLSARGKKISEVVLTDGQVLAMEIQKFYEDGVVRNRTQYRVLRPDSLEKKKYDSLWYDLNPKLVKAGREEIFYPNQKPMLARVYDNGLLRDSLYTELYSNGVVKKTYSTRGGVLHGSARSYDKQGKLLGELVFNNGKVVKKVVAGTEASQHKKAFLLGVSDYGVPSGLSGGKTWNKYPFMSINTANDLDTLRDVLVTYNGFDPARITTVTDEAATRNQLLAALRKFSASLQKGDIVFFHVSSQGIIIPDQPDSLRKFEGLAIPCRDANYPDNPSLSSSNFIFQYQLEAFFNDVKKVIGKTGQLIISLDACHSGKLLSYQAGTENNKEVTAIASRGESNNMLFNLVRDENIPTIIYTATTSEGLGYEMRDDRGKIFGAYSLALAGALSSPLSLNSEEVHEEVVSFLKENAKRQVPGYLANETQFLFEGKDAVGDNDKEKVKLPAIKPAGNVFILSAGVTDYALKTGEQLSFKNCEADAKAYGAFFQKQYEDLGGSRDGKKLYSSLLINQDATRENILAAINNAISNSKPDDYFIFNFSGYCKPLRDNSGKQVTWFVPFGLKSINDSAEIREKGISLTQLKDLLQMIPANNQLFITEAGSTDDFQKEFIQALIETSPTIASLSNKNRIFIVPNGSGLDNFSCNNSKEEHGPINYFVTNLSDDLNIFGLFEGGIYADAIKFNLNKTAVGCNFFRTAYFDVFFEREFMRDIRYFLPEELMQSRGAGLINKDKAAVANAIAKKYALLVGTNTYEGKPQWKDLEGIPVLDVRSIGTELKNHFGFEVITLVDKPSDSIYESIIRLSKTLKPNDQLLIYVAGHGDYDENLFDDGFIVCANSKQAKDDPYRNTYIQYSKLSRMINKLPASQVMMVLDVCFGGSFAEKVVRCSNRSGYEDLSSADYISGKLKLKTRLFLSSGGKKEVPNGYKGRLSPFAQRFLQCLQTRGGDSKLLSSSSFYEFVKKLPSGPVIGSFGDDECGSEFLMLSK